MSGSGASSANAADALAVDSRNARIANWRSRLLAAVRLEERLRLLFDLGLTDSEIARTLPEGDRKARSVRRWRLEGVARGRTAARWEPIDDLCVVVGFLLADGTYDEEGVVAWLRSRQPELELVRPLDALGAGRYEAVLEAAERTRGPVAVQAPTTDGPLAQASAEAC